MAGGAFGWWNSNGNFAADWQPPAEQRPAIPGPAAWDQPARNRAARDQAAREQPAREQGAWERPVRERHARDQAAREQPAREQAAQWHTGRQDIRDEPVPARPVGARGGAPGSYQPDADRYPADFPTQVFMSSALAAWEQPPQAAPAGTWPRIAEPPGPPSRYEPAEPPARPESAAPPGQYQPAGPPGARRAADRARPAGPRHATAGPPPGSRRPGRDQAPATGAAHYPPAGTHRAALEHQAAPFPPAPDPAELYPAPPGPGRPAVHPAPWSPPSAERRGSHGGLLIGAACLAVLIAVALVLFVVLPG